MKNRVSTILNFLSFNLLFFALYLNFVHQDTESFQPIANQKKSALVPSTVAARQLPGTEIKPDVTAAPEKRSHAATLSGIEETTN